MSFTTRTLFNILKSDGVLKPGRALDLGCGIGRDAIFLSKNNYKVDAIDGDIEVVKQIPTSETLSTFTSKIEDFKIPKNIYELVSSQYVLHFLPKETANKMIEKMVAAAVPGGVISFNILGENDEWKNKWTTWRREEVEELLKNLPVTIHKVITEEGDGMTRAGVMKYWHVINFILIKKQ